MGFGLVVLCGVAAAPPDLPPLPIPVPALQPGAVEVAPAPHTPHPPVAIHAVKGGYQVYLNRATADFLRDALDRGDEKEIAAMLRKKAKEKKEADPDDHTAATLEMIAFVVSNQMPKFKKSFAENIGPGGAVITLTGLQAPAAKFRKPRPKLEKAAEVVREVMPLLPDEAREVVESLRAVARTTPLSWKVEPRE